MERELELVLSQETFDGGTDITRGMLDAAKYIGREGRKEARHAIVILTDDQTERDREDESVLRALGRADAVMSALIAPDALAGRYGGGGWGGWWRGGRAAVVAVWAAAGREVAVADWVAPSAELSSDLAGLTADAAAVGRSS